MSEKLRQKRISKTAEVNKSGILSLSGSALASDSARYRIICHQSRIACQGLQEAAGTRTQPKAALRLLRRRKVKEETWRGLLWQQAMPRAPQGSLKQPQYSLRQGSLQQPLDSRSQGSLQILRSQTALKHRKLHAMCIQDSCQAPQYCLDLGNLLLDLHSLKEGKPCLSPPGWTTSSLGRGQLPQGIRPQPQVRAAQGKCQQIRQKRQSS